MFFICSVNDPSELQSDRVSIIQSSLHVFRHVKVVFKTERWKLGGNVSTEADIVLLNLFSAHSANFLRRKECYQAVS